MGRSFNRVYLYPFGHALGRDVLPILSAVARNIDKAVVRACPYQAFLKRRFHYGEDGAVVLDACVVFSNRAARRALLRFVVARQIGAYRLPTLTLVIRFEENIARSIE